METYEKRHHVIIQTVIQDHILDTKTTNCVGPLVCSFFDVALLPNCKLVCYNRKKAICRPCGRKLVEHILESWSYDFKEYNQKQCNFNSTIGRTINRCSRIVLNNSSLFRLCPDHICDFCVEEARKDMDRLVCLILCLQHTPGFRDLIGLISGFFRSVFDRKRMHLKKFRIVINCRFGREEHWPEIK